mgnify:CR=1 FL=1
MNFRAAWVFVRRIVGHIAYWILMTISLVLMLWGNASRNQFGQIAFGILVLPWVVLTIWGAILTVNAVANGHFPWRRLFTVIVALIFVGLMGSCVYRATVGTTSDTPPAGGSSTNVAPPAASTPEPIYATTPVTLTIDYPADVQVRKPIMIKYMDEEAFLFTPDPDGGCVQLPAPKYSGTKSFWDPNDKEKGHIRFQLYAASGRCP